MKWIRRNPVLAFTAAVALYGVAVAQLRAQMLVGDQLLEWLVWGGAVLSAALGLVVHGAVTPVNAPRDDAGSPLVPAAAVPPAVPSMPATVPAQPGGST